MLEKGRFYAKKGVGKTTIQTRNDWLSLPSSWFHPAITLQMAQTRMGCSVNPSNPSARIAQRVAR